MRNTIAFITILALAGLSFSTVNITGCSVLSTQGETYLLTQDANGAPNPYYSGAYNTCVQANASNIEFDCQGHTITPGTLVSGPTGIEVGGFSNVTVRNCIINSTAGFGNSAGIGFSFTDTVDALIINNTVNSAYYGIRGLGSPIAVHFENNTLAGGRYGFFAPSSGPSTYIANSVYGDYAAFYLWGSGETVSLNNASSPSGNCFELSGTGGDITENIAEGCGSYGFYIGGDSNHLADNLVISSGAGFMVSQSSFNVLARNNASGLSGAGFEIQDLGGGESFNNITDSIACGDVDGFRLVNADNDYLFNNTACNNSQSGFYILGSSDNLLENNTASDNPFGVYIEYSSGINLSGNGIHGSSASGVSLHDANVTRLDGDLLYGNMFDIAAYDDTTQSQLLELVRVTIDDPSGDLEDTTVLSLYDDYGNESFGIFWAENASAPEPGYLSYGGRFVNISLNGTPLTLDSVTWHWDDAEASAGGYDESRFVLSRFSNGSWAYLNDTPDTGNNELTVSGLSGFSQFGLLQNNVSENCPIINQSGSYTQTMDFTGAPNSPSPLGGGSVCLKIAAPDVEYDCNGFSIANNGTAGTTYAIFLNNSASNVTLKNCPAISGYSYGVYLYRVNDSVFTNISVINATAAAFDVSEGRGNDFLDCYGNATGYGFYLSSTANNSIVNCTVRSANAYGFLLTSSSNNTITDSSVQNCQYGIGVTAGTNNSFYGNTLPINAGGYGFSVSGQNNTIINNSVNNSAYAYYFVGSSNNTVVNNTAFNSSNYGLFLTSASFNQTVVNNTFRESGLYDFFIVVSNAGCGHFVKNNTGSGYRPIMFANSAVSWSDIDAAEVFLCDADGSTIENVTADGSDTLRNNGFFLFLTDASSINGSASLDNYHGFYLDSSDNNTITSGRASNASQGFGYYILNSSDNEFRGNLANHSANGFYLSSNSNGNILLGNAANSTTAAFYLSQVSGNNLTNNTAISAAGYGFYLYTSGNGTISGNSVSALYGAYISYYSSNNSITGNQMASPNEAFHLSLSSNNIIGNASINGYGAGRGVFLESGSDNNTFSDLSLGNFVYGIYLFGTNAGNGFSGGLVCNNTYGATIAGSDLTRLEGARFCNNSRDFWIEAGGASRVVNLSSVIFDSPAGNLANYTNLSLDDIVSSGSSYQINWSGPGAPAGYVSFAGKSVNITNLTGTVSIDSIRWSWSESELSGYIESDFELWKSNSSGWTLLNSTPDTANNVIGLTSMSPASDYGILQAGCTSPADDYLVNESTVFCSGTYYLNDTGSAGIIIANNNSINITCDNTTIIGNGAGSGIYALSRSGLNISGCTIINYSIGITLDTVSSSDITNNTVVNTTSHGIYNRLPLYDRITGNRITNPAGAGISLYHSGNSLDYGYSLVDGNIISGPAGGHSIYLEGSAGVGQGLKYVNVTDNVFGNSSYGITIAGYNNGAPSPQMYYNRVVNNTCGNTTRCVNLYSNGGFGNLRYNVFENNTFRSSSYGVYLQGTGDYVVSDNNFSGNRFEEITTFGVAFASAFDYKNRFWGGNTFDNETFYHFYGDTDLSVDGISMDVSPLATNLCSFTAVQVNRLRLSNSTFDGNGDCSVYFYDSDNSAIEGNDITNATTGIWLHLPVNTTVRDNIIHDTSSIGIYDAYPYQDTIVNNSIRNTTTAGIYLFKDSPATIDYGYSTVADNTVDGPASGYSIYLHGIGGVFQGIKQVNVTNNSLGNSSYGIFIHGQGTGAPTPEMYYNRIAGNTIRNTTISINLYSSGDTGRLRYNTFEDNLLQDSDYGVYINGNNDYSVGYNNFSGNNLTGISQYGVFFTNTNHYKNSFRGLNTFEGRPFYHYFGDTDMSVGDLTVDVHPNATNLCSFNAVLVNRFNLTGSVFKANGDCAFYSWDSDNLLFQGNNVTNATNGVWLYRSVNHTVRDSIVQNTSASAILLNLPTGDVVANNSISNATTAGIYLLADSVAAGFGYSSVENNTVSGPAAGTSIYLHGVAQFSLQYVNVTNNDFGNSTYGLYLHGQGTGAPTPQMYYNLISNNRCGNATYCYNIYASGDSGNLKYNVFHNNSASSPYGITIAGTGSGGVSSNNFTSNILNSTVYPVSVSTSAPANNRFSGNVLENDLQSDFISSSAVSNNYTNTTFVRNLGRINFPQNVPLAKSVNSLNTVLDSYIASIDSASLGELAIPANVTMASAQCPATIYRLAGFPLTSAQIAANGSVCSGPQCVQHSCLGNITTFSVSSFSGYSANVTNCMLINSPGEYAQSGDFTGAPNTNLPVAGSACVHINSSDVLYDCAGYSMSHNRSADTFGIFAGGNLANVTIRNCPNITQYYRGIYLYRVNSSLIENVTARHNANAGYYLWETDNLTFIRNTAFNNTFYGAYFTFNPKSSNISDNTFDNHSLWGLVVTNGALNNSVSGNIAHDNAGDGIAVNGNGNSVSGNLAYDNGNEIFLGNGIYISGSNNTVRDNIAENNTRSGYWVSNSFDSLFMNNSAGGNTRDGFYIESGARSNFTGNVVTGNGWNGFLLSDSNLNLYENNTVAANNASGFNISWGGEGDPSDNNTIRGNIISDNSRDGVYLDLAIGNGILSNNISGSGRAGVYLSPGEDPFLTGTGTFLSGNLYYSNNFDLIANSTPDMSYAMSGDIFTNPSGTLENYTNLSVNDTVAGEAYYLNWTENSTSLPVAFTSFERKFVDISGLEGIPSLDFVVWHYLDSEASAYDESSFGVYEYETAWTDIGATRDASANTLSFTNLSSFSEFGILSATCPLITSPGTYVQTVDLSGAPNPVDAPDLPASQACVVIDSDDVIYDCDGHTLTGGLPSGTIGVFVNRTLNVTVRNCGISDYSYGAVSYGGDDTTLENLTVGYAGIAASEGILVAGGTGHLVSGNTINVSESAIRLTGTVSGANVSGNTVPDANYGIYLTGTLNDSDFEGNFISNVEDGFRVPAGSWISELVDVTGNRFRGNTVINSSHAFIIVNSTGNVFEYNSIENAFQEGFYILQSRNNLSDSVFRYNNLTNVDDAFYMYYSGNNLFEGNRVNGTTSYVFWFLESGNSSITDNIVPSARYFAYFDLCPNLSVTGNAANGTGIQYAAQVVSSTNFFAFNNTIAGFSRGPWHWDAFSGNSNTNISYINNTFANMSGGESLYCAYCPNSTFSGNMFINAYTGMLVSNSENVVISDNSMLNKSTGGGILLFNLTDLNLSGNFVQGPYVPNVTFDGGCLHSNQIVNGRFIDNELTGCYNLANFINMNASLVDGLDLSDGNSPFTIQSSFGNTIGNVSVSGTTDSFSPARDVQVYQSSGNQLSGFNLSGGGSYGVHLTNSSLNVFEDFDISGSGTGLFVGDGPGDDQLYDFHFHGNGLDARLNATSASNTIHLFNAIFDSPGGNFQNFTNLTVHDTVNAGESYSIDWSANASSPPWPIFLGKHIDITNDTYTGIDYIAWHWTDAEASGYDESRFMVWKDNGTWSDTGASLDTGANILRLEEYDSFSGFAILIDGNCPVINASGTYIQPLDYTGAPNAAAHGPTNACVVIDADDVVFDCDGHSITNDASYASAFYINGRDNITIRNCVTDGYVDDIYAQESALSEVSDNLLNASYSVLEMNASFSPSMMFVRNNVSSSSAYALINARNYYDGANLFTTDISGSLVENNTVDGVTYTEIVSEAANLSGITVRNNDFNAPGLYALIYADDHYGSVHTGTDLSDALIENNTVDASYAAIASDAADVRNLIIRNNTLGVPAGMSYLVACQVYYDGSDAYVTNLSNATIESNIVNLGSSAIGASSGADVSGLTMRDNSFNGGGIFSLASVRRSDFGTVVTIAEFEDSLIENNAINNLGFAGLELYGAGASGLVFRNNTANGSGIYAMIDAGTVQSGNDVYPTDMTGSLIEGNRFERISYTGINARGSDLSGMVFRNNSLLNNESSGSAYAAFNIQSIDNGTGLLARGNISGADIEDNAFSGFSIILSLSGTDASDVSLARNNATTLAQMNSFIYAYPQASGPLLFSHVDLSGADISDNHAYNYAYGINAVGTDLTDSLISGNAFSAGPSLGSYGIGLQSYSPASLVFESDISGTRILSNDIEEYNSGIYLYDTKADNLTIEGNDIIDTVSSGSYGIYSSWGLNPTGIMTSSRISGNTMENEYYGIYLRNGTNTTISGNGLSVNGYSIYLEQSRLDLVQANNMTEIGISGIYLYESDQNTFDGNRMTDSAVAGIQALSSDGNAFHGDTVDSAVIYGILLGGSNGNSFEDAVISNINNTAGSAYGINLGGSTGNSFTNVSASGVSSTSGLASGFYLGGSNNNSFADSAVSEIENPSGTAYGVYLGGSNGNNFTNVASSLVSSASGDASGFYLGGSNNNTVSGSTASDNLAYGFYLAGAGGNLMSGSEAYGNGQAGLYLSGSSFNLFDANMFHDNPIGYRLSGSGNNTFLDNIAANNTMTGALVHFGSSGNSFTDEAIYGNSEGIETGDGASSNLWTGPHLYMNALDFLYNGSGSSYRLSGAIFDSASGAFENFTNLSVNDSVGAPETYHITWDSEPAAPPYPSFAQKYVEMVNYTPVSIESAAWHWTDAEAAGYNETKFELWKHDGAWSIQDSSPDTGGNELGLSGIDGFSTFGILQNNLSTNISALKLDQTAAQPSPGGLVQFNITIGNGGGLALDPVRVVDELPAGLSFDSAFPAPDSQIGQALIWDNVSSLGPGSQTVIFINATVDSGIVSPANPVVNLTNSVNATGTDQYGDNVTAAGSAQVTVYHAGVSVLKVDQTAAQASPGGIVQFNITVTNTGNATLDPVQVEDELPFGMEYDSAIPVPDVIDPEELDWLNVGPLAPGESATILLNTTVNGSLVNSSVPLANATNCALAAGSPPNGYVVISESCADVTIYHQDVTIVKLDVTPLPPSPGGMVQWEINVSNPGLVTLDPVSLTDTLPSGFIYSSASPAPDTVSGQEISWDDLGPIAPGGSVVVLLNSSVAGNASNGTYSNSANVSASPPNGDDATASDTSQVGVYAPALNVVKSASNTTVPANQPVEFTVNVTNSGSIALMVDIVDSLPQNVTFMNASVAPTSVAGNLISWLNLTTLAPGSSMAILYNVSASSSGIYTNDVTATGVPPNGYNASDSDGSTFIVVPPNATADDDDDGERPLRVSLESACEGNNVTVRSGSSPVSGVQVRIDGQSIGTTGSSGTIAFPGCGKTVDVRASRSGYVTEEGSFTLASCSCGLPQNETVPTPPEPVYECLTDDGCADADFCSIPAGAQGGECLPVEIGACGEVGNHRFVPYGYQCGTEPGCPSCPAGAQCVDHSCISYELAGPETVHVNETATIFAFNSTGSCRLCDILIVDPAGKSLSGKTDENGSIILPAYLQGIYNVTLLVDGQPFRSILINALPRSVPGEPEKPVEASPQEQFPWWIVIILLLLIALIVYWRRRKKK